MPQKLRQLLIAYQFNIPVSKTNGMLTIISLDICQVMAYNYAEVMTLETLLIKEKQDLRYLHWSRIRNSSGTAGSFLKAWSELEGTKIYYKLSNYDNILGVIGHESVNELIVDRLLNILGVEHLHYQLVHAAIVLDGKKQDTYICASENFRSRDEDKQSIDICYASERVDGETPLDFCLRKGWSKYIWEMLVVDFLILNRDRHGANIEVLRNKNKHPPA